MEAPRQAAALSPVQDLQADPGAQQGTALCLSGGGYRAMLFHVGALWRLNELGQLPKLDLISSVSGGSITAAALGRSWSSLEFDGAGVAQAFDRSVVSPLRKLAQRTIDVRSVLGGVLSPRRTISDDVAAAYRKHLFGRATLQDLPDRPRFVFNATNVQTGSLWRFSKPFMADYRVGLVRSPQVELAQAVAASSAFPPVLSPLLMTLDPSSFDEAGRGPLCQPPYTTHVLLTDGGVYDNLGLETAWKSEHTVLISDGGGLMAAEPKPHRDWARHSLRINSLIDNQVRSLRKRQALAGFASGARGGTYWGIRSHVADYGLPAPTLPCPPEPTLALANTETRLAHTDDELQERIINWGYAICDVAMRRWVLKGVTAPPRFPYPARGVG